MHQLAICLQHKGHTISGSDDVIFDPARSNLADAGLLPPEEGWFPAKLNPSIEAIILGMHAKVDNPELKKAKELKIPIYSFPEFIYKETADKTRIVIGGSHGKTTITSMITHVFQKLNAKFDILVGAKVPGIDQMVQLHKDTQIAIIEGDEYLSSPIDLRPKFIHYKANIAVINGIAWDHINVFPTFEAYKHQFELFLNSLESNATVYYNAVDDQVVELIKQWPEQLNAFPYSIPNYTVDGLASIIHHNGKDFPLSIFGKHNMNNLDAARKICTTTANISDEEFYSLIADYTGAARRLEVIYNQKDTVLIKDFAHAPSKVTASVKAVKEAFPNQEVVAFFELHTYSSLNPDFIPQYAGALDAADKAFIFFDEHALKIKKLPDLAVKAVQRAFNNDKIEVINDKIRLQEIALKQSDVGKVFLMMSSGSWAKTDLLEQMRKKLDA